MSKTLSRAVNVTILTALLSEWNPLKKLAFRGKITCENSQGSE